MPPPYPPLFGAFIEVVDPILAALVVGTGGLLISRLMLHRTEPLLPRRVGTVLCWAAMIASLLTLGIGQVIKIGVLL